MSITSGTGLRFTIQPESSKATHNRPFHGMMHLQTPCSPALSPLIPQVVITAISLCLSGPSVIVSVESPGPVFFLQRYPKIT